MMWSKVSCETVEAKTSCIWFMWLCGEFNYLSGHFFFFLSNGEMVPLESLLNRPSRQNRKLKIFV